MAITMPSSRILRLPLGRIFLAVLLSLAPAAAPAGAQIEEALAANVQNSLRRSASDYPAPHLVFATDIAGLAWLADMSSRLAAKIPYWPTRCDSLVTAQYAAARCCLEPQLA